jgi:hypothetical protein
MKSIENVKIENKIVITRMSSPLNDRRSFIYIRTRKITSHESDEYSWAG